MYRREWWAELRHAEFRRHGADRRAFHPLFRAAAVHPFGFEEACLWQNTKGRHAGERYANPLVDLNGEELGVREGEYGPDIFCEYGLDFIERHKDVPFFWYYPMVLTHEPFFMTPHSENWESGDKIQNGAVCDSLVDFSDFLPTIADAAGLPLDRYADLDGQSFLHHLAGESGPEREWIYCHYIPWSVDNDQFAIGRMIYGKRYKLYRTGKVYDIENDFLEESPLPDDDPVVTTIRAQYEPVFHSRPTWDSAVARMNGERFQRP